jgi:hypothetical protein
MVIELYIKEIRRERMREEVVCIKSEAIKLFI